jgi:hypothetical protein
MLVTHCKAVCKTAEGIGPDDVAYWIDIFALDQSYRVREQRAWPGIQPPAQPADDLVYSEGPGKTSMCWDMLVALVLKPSLCTTVLMLQGPYKARPDSEVVGC